MGGIADRLNEDRAIVPASVHQLATASQASQLWAWQTRSACKQRPARLLVCYIYVGGFGRGATDTAAKSPLPGYSFRIDRQHGATRPPTETPQTPMSYGKPAGVMWPRLHSARELVWTAPLYAPSSCRYIREDIKAFWAYAYKDVSNVTWERANVCFFRGKYAP